MNPTIKLEIKLAHVGSLGTYRRISLIGNIDACLATLAMKNVNYFNFYKSQAVKGRFVILDSGLFESFLGTEQEKISQTKYLKMAIKMDASEIVCPDSPNNSKETFLSTREFIRLWKDYPSHRKPALMIAPHGQTSEEWMENLRSLIEIGNIQTVGIPRIVNSTITDLGPFPRVSLAKAIKKHRKDVYIHFLGAADNFLQELALANKTGYVRSCDSTFILRYATARSDPLKSYAKPVLLRDNKKQSYGFWQRVNQLKSYFQN